MGIRQGVESRLCGGTLLTLLSSLSSLLLPLSPSLWPLSLLLLTLPSLMLTRLCLESGKSSMPTPPLIVFSSALCTDEPEGAIIHSDEGSGMPLSCRSDPRRSLELRAMTSISSLMKLEGSFCFIDSAACIIWFRLRCADSTSSSESAFSATLLLYEYFTKSNVANDAFMPSSMTKDISGTMCWSSSVATKNGKS